MSKAQDRSQFTIFRAKHAPEIVIGEFDEITPVIADGLERLNRAGATDGGESRVIFEIPGFSLTYAWFKSQFPLPIHSHREDCLYYVTGGSLRLGTETLEKGDGFFVPGGTPYTYTPGQRGVEVIEFRHDGCIDMRLTAKNRAYWDRAVAKVKARREGWKTEGKPEAV